MAGVVSDMRTWVRAEVLTLCGGSCHGQIEPDAPILLISLPGVKRRLIRCQVCAGEEVPPMLPRTVKKSPFTKRMQPIARIAGGFDWKAKQAGARELGDEGF